MSTFTLNLIIVFKYWTEAKDRLNRKEKVPAFVGPIVQETPEQETARIKILDSMKNNIKVLFSPIFCHCIFVCAITQKRRTELRQLILMFHHHLSSAQFSLLF